jgi:kynurenine formamidase
MGTVRELWRGMECIDLSVILSEEYPVTWPGLPAFRKRVLNWFEDYREPNGETVKSLGAFYDQTFTMDEHMGTHVDFPPHILPPADLAQHRQRFGESVPVSVFAGAAVVLDARAYLDQAPAGTSPRVPAQVALDWEAKNGAIEADDVALVNTGYMDRYFLPFPEGKRLVDEPVYGKNVPGWPVPSDELFELLGRRGVRHLGIASPSVGALDDGLGPHRVGLALGMTFAEGLVNLHKLPPRGALYVGLPLKISKQSGSPIRAVAFVPKAAR